MIKTYTKKKVIKEPRISANKLAEYVLATASRRKRILLDAKYPETFITTRYKEAREIAKAYLCGNVTIDFVKQEINKFKNTAIAAAKIPKNDYQVQYHNQSADALDSLLNSKIPLFNGANIIKYDEQAKIIIMKGVAISVRPDLILKADIGGIINVGAIKLHITQTTKLSNESQKIVGVLLYEYVKKHVINVVKNEVANSKLCVSFDIFKQQFDVCPPAMKRILTQVQDSCEEISSRWDKI